MAPVDHVGTRFDAPSTIQSPRASLAPTISIDAGGTGPMSATASRRTRPARMMIRPRVAT